MHDGTIVIALSMVVDGMRVSFEKIVYPILSNIFFHDLYVLIPIRVALFMLEA